MSESKMVDKTKCGHKKWSIGFNENCAVVVSFDHYPNVGVVELYDASDDDLRNLGEMFLSLARKGEQLSKKD